MSPATDRLRHAREELEDATETADGDARDDLRETAGAFAEITSGEREADYAVLDEHLNTLRQVERRVDGETAERVERALDHAEDYRSELDQA